MVDLLSRRSFTLELLLGGLLGGIAFQESKKTVPPEDIWHHWRPFITMFLPPNVQQLSILSYVHPRCIIAFRDVRRTSSFSAIKEIPSAENSTTIILRYPALK
ncbi:hypothetical protein CEXT_646451 [Caerostris extrusa]|uniref:Uncharacterized protein n=1 Tax=Caerostris extrusa TaxID=172846 RepID=A0AAV4M8N7_CAEEX|nr:hypothetical protein CEXT_646451 [Caerostris extrusa]